MQRPIRNLLLYPTCLVVLTTLGCANGSRQPALYQPPDTPPQQRAEQTAAQAALQPSADNESSAMSPGEMQLMIARLEALETDNQRLKQQVSDRYIEEVNRRRAELEAQQQGTPSTTPAGTVQANGGAAQSQTNAQAAGGIDSFSRPELLDALVTQIVEGDDPERIQALMVAAISVASPRHDLDHRLLDQLDPRGREQVARFHQMLAVAYDELAGDARATLTRREMIEKIDEVFGAQPLSIEAFELCRRVDSYGVYEPFVTTRFLAGRLNRVLVYVELENFHHEPTEDGRFEVRLEQQVELYDATGETTVWRQGPVELVDVSRNQRRDFFIVYPIDLPARLPAGGYRLKVRVADKHTGSICEQTMHEIQIVADQALVGNER